MAEHTTDPSSSTNGFDKGWGPWSFDPELLTLDHRLYQIDLERCRTSADVLDWIIQIAGKTWADDATLAGLVRALNSVLNPQATLCSQGVEQGPIDPTVVVPNVVVIRQALSEGHRHHREQQA